MAANYSRELEVGLAAVYKASVLTKVVMNSVGPDDKSDKSDASPVTIADFAAQALIICTLRRHFPDDNFIAEESADMLRNDPVTCERTWQVIQFIQKLVGRIPPFPKSKEEMLEYIDLGCNTQEARPGRVWILDPVDGTATFLQGRQYAVCLSFTVDGEQKVGVIGCPNLSFKDGKVEEDSIDATSCGVMLSAVLGEGATMSTMSENGIGKPLDLEAPEPKEVRDLQFTDSIASSNVVLPLHRKVWSDLQIDKDPIDLWSMQMKYVALALGASDALIRIPPKRDYRASVWDHAGGQLIYQETGGKVTDLNGNSFDFGKGRRLLSNWGVVAASPDTHGKVFEAVQNALKDHPQQSS